MSQKKTGKDREHLPNKTLAQPFNLGGPNTVPLNPKEHKVAPDKPLTSMEAEFVENMMVCEDPVDALKKSGFRAKDLQAKARQLMRKPNIVEAIRVRNIELQKKRLKPEYINEHIVSLLESPHTPPATRANLISTAAKIAGMMNEGGGASFNLEINLSAPDNAPPELADIINVKVQEPDKEEDGDE